MTAETVLSGIRNLLAAHPQEALWGACGAVLLLLVLVLLRSRSRRASSLGIRKLATDHPELPAAFDRSEPAGTPTVFTTEITEAPSVTAVTSETITEAAHPPVVQKVSVPSITATRDEPEAPAFEPENRATDLVALPDWQLLKTLPFVSRRDFVMKHLDIAGIGIEAVVFPESVNTVQDTVTRLVPFLPEGTLLFREADRRTFSFGDLFAQPDAVIEIDRGLVCVEYKSRGGRPDDPADLARSLRLKDLLQTVLQAIALSASTGRPAAPVLRTHTAAYFLRPAPELTALLTERLHAGAAFVAPYSRRRGIAASDYAALCAVVAEVHFGTDTEPGGEAAHLRMTA